MKEYFGRLVLYDWKMLRRKFLTQNGHKTFTPEAPAFCILTCFLSLAIKSEFINFNVNENAATETALAVSKISDKYPRKVLSQKRKEALQYIPETWTNTTHLKFTQLIKGTICILTMICHYFYQRDLFQVYHTDGNSLNWTCAVCCSRPVVPTIPCYNPLLCFFFPTHSSKFAFFITKSITHLPVAANESPQGFSHS